MTHHSNKRYSTTTANLHVPSRFPKTRLWRQTLKEGHRPFPRSMPILHPDESAIHNMQCKGIQKPAYVNDPLKAMVHGIPIPLGGSRTCEKKNTQQQNRNESKLKYQKPVRPAVVVSWTTDRKNTTATTKIPSLTSMTRSKTKNKAKNCSVFLWTCIMIIMTLIY